MNNDKILLSFFQLLSKACVHNPFETIILIISLCVSLSLLASSPSGVPLQVLLSSHQANQKAQISYSNVSFVMILRCLAFVCLFVQFKNLKIIQSKLILTASILITLISSIVLNNALMSWSSSFKMANNFILIIDMVIYTLALIDMNKCNQILNDALDTPTIREAKLKIVTNFAEFASTSSLDTFFLVLLIALGSLSDSNEIKSFSKFSCILLASNFFIFITIYPALLSLILQFKKRDRPSHAGSKRLDKQMSEGASSLAESSSRPIFTLGESSSPPSRQLSHSAFNNPVLVYVKILMTGFLVVIHLKSNIFNGFSTAEKASKDEQTHVYLNNEPPVLEEPTSSINSEIIFYTECCLFFMLIIYMLTKSFLKEPPPSTGFYATKLGLVNTADKTQQTDDLPNDLKSSRSIPTQTDFRVKLDSVHIDELDLRKERNSSSTSIAAAAAASTETLQAVATVRAPAKRSMAECLELLKERTVKMVDDFSDEEVIDLVQAKHILAYKLESYFSNPIRGIKLRRHLLEAKLNNNRWPLTEIPYEHFNYNKVIGSCCENIVGYVPIPLGVVGPVLIDGKYFQVPMATTEGTLVASTNRGCNALSNSNAGVFTKIVSDGMTRGPVIRFPSGMRAVEAKEWAEQPDNFAALKKSFDSTSRFAKLQSIKCAVAGRSLYMRFLSQTGDAMGMNMLSKGSEKALQELQKQFPDSEIMSVSGNYCTDKKPSALNWIEGRGKSVICEAIVKADVVTSVLKTSVKALVDLNISKNLVGSALAGSIGGFNAHAANIVSAVFIACGQDPAQVVEGCNCLTWMEPTGTNNEDLYISCTMPSIEVGTVGGGTGLDAQSACLKMLGVHGSNAERPGENACQLARIVAATVMAGELSLMSALASGQLVNSHMRYNRATIHPHVSTNMHACFL